MQNQGGIAPLVNTFNQLAASQAVNGLNGQLVLAAQTIIEQHKASLAKGGQNVSGGSGTQANPNQKHPDSAPMQENPAAGSANPDIVVEEPSSVASGATGGRAIPNFSEEEEQSEGGGDPPPRKSLAPDWGKNPFIRVQNKKDKKKNKDKGLGKNTDKAKQQRARFASPASSVSSVGSPRGRAGSRGEKIARVSKENEQLSNSMRNYVSNAGQNTPGPSGENASKKRKQISPTGGGTSEGRPVPRWLPCHAKGSANRRCVASVYASQQGQGKLSGYYSQPLLHILKHLVQLLLFCHLLS